MDPKNTLFAGMATIRSRLLMAMLAGQAVAAILIAIPILRGRDQVIVRELERSRVSRTWMLASGLLASITSGNRAWLRESLQDMTSLPDCPYAVLIGPDGDVVGRPPPSSEKVLLRQHQGCEGELTWNNKLLETCILLEAPGSRRYHLLVGYDVSETVSRLDSIQKHAAGLATLAVLVGLILTMALGDRLVRNYMTITRFAHVKLLENERMTTLVKMAADISHEIRSPLASLSLDIEMLLDDLDARAKPDEACIPPCCARDPDEPATASCPGLPALKSMKRSIDHIHTLTEEYLGLADLSPTAPVNFPAGSLVDTAMAITKELDPPAGISVRTRPVPAAQNARVNVDPVRIRMALKALLQNAIQALKTSGSIEIRSARRENQVVIEIADDGPGIDPSIRDRVMQPFVTTHPNQSGLGLFLASRILKDHGGHLELDSKAGGGTTVRINLPCEA